MLNILGAVLLTFMLIGLYREGYSLRKLNQYLIEFPLWKHSLILLLLLILFSAEAFGFMRSFWMVSIPHMVFDGAGFFIHEAGHIYWRWGPKFLMVAGGTLNEVLFTLGPAVFCFYKGYYQLIPLFVFWLGYNCFGIGEYASGAKENKLDVIFEPGSTHDWNYMLKSLNLLEFDQEIGLIIKGVGYVIVLLSFALYFVLLFRSPKALISSENKRG